MFALATLSQLAVAVQLAAQQPVSQNSTNASASITPHTNVFDRFDQPPPPANKIPSWWAAVTSDPSMTNSIVTRSGITYHNAKVTIVEPDGLSIKYLIGNNGGLGIKKISFEDFPLNVQQQYGYDPKNASAYIAQKKQEAMQAEVNKQNQLEQDRQEELAAEAAAAKILYEREQQAYAKAKENYDRQIQLASLQAQQKAALAQTLQAREAAQQTTLMRYNALLQQQQLYQQQQQTYQQQRTADGINNLNQQIIFNRILGQ